uniref:Uncharacterized protein n=1 Tax=Panagrolaimus superbus TaxID=310955 RepID=A0A914XXK3_9BILA
MSGEAVPKQEFTKGTHLLSFDKAKKIKFFGKCKLSITPAEKCLTLKLDDGASSEMSSTFNRRFFVVENFLCASDFLTKKDFIIIFSQKATCEKVYQEIEKAKSTSKSAASFKANPVLEENLFKTDFFIPIVKEIQRYGYIEIKKILLGLINSFDNKKMDLYFTLMVETLLSRDGRICKIEPPDNAKDKSDSFKVVDDVVVKGEMIEAFTSSIATCSITENELVENGSLIPQEREVSHNISADTNINETTYFDDNNSDGDDEDVDGEEEESDATSNLSENISEIRRKNLRERSVNVSYAESPGFEEDDCSEDSSDVWISFNCSDDESSDDDIPSAKKSKLTADIKNSKPSTSSLDSLNYEVCEFTEGGKLRKRLLVFTSSDRKKCYQYSYSSGHNNYHCRKCDPRRHYVCATFVVDDMGIKELTFGRNQHLCKPIDYVPENYKSPEIIKFPAFKIVEKLSKKRMVKRLIIFADKGKCYEYSLNDKGIFHCLACIILKRYVSAKLIKDSDNGDYLELNRAKHICKPKKYIDSDTPVETVHKPFFKILTVENGKGYKRRTLKIFNSSNMAMFYSYYYSTSFKCFICSGCTKEQPHRQVTAKVCQDENGANFIELSKIEHICSMKNSNSVR